MFNGKLFKTFLSLEFKDDIVTTVCFKNNLLGINILSYASFPLKDHNDEEIVTEIKKFIDKNKVEKEKVFVCIPHKWVMTKFMELPLAGGEKSISQIMHYEIGKHVPFPIDDIFYDFAIADKKDASCRVVLVAVQKERVEYIKAFLERLSLKSQSINVSTFSTVSTIILSGVKVGGLYEILGIRRKSDIVGHKRKADVLLFFTGDEAILSTIKNSSCLYLKTFDFSQHDAMEATLEKVSSAIKDGVSTSSLQKADSLILSGDIPSFAGFSNGLMEKTGVRTVIANPLLRFFPVDKAKELQWLIPSIGACFSGLGIGDLRINLLPHKSDKDAKKTGLLITKICLLLILFLSIGILAGKVINEKKYLEGLEYVVKKNEPDVAAVQKLSDELRVFEEQKNLLLNIKNSDIALNVLLELSNLIPTDAWITSINYKKLQDKENKALNAEITIIGYAVSASRLISILEDSPIFERVEFIGPITKAKDKEGFKIKAVAIYKQ